MVSTDLISLLRQERQRELRVRKIAELSSKERQDDDLQILTITARKQDAIILNDFAVGRQAVQGLFYIPDFLTPEEAAAVARLIDAAPQHRWVTAGERRLQNWGGKPSSHHVSEELPPFLKALVDRLLAAGVYAREEAPQHCLINDYRRAAGIPAHQDGPLYLDRVATLTLEGPALLSFHQMQPCGSPGELVTQVLLQAGCLLIVAGEAYTHCLHSIASDSADVVSDSCCNRLATGHAPGDVVQRAERRMSLVFVHKLQR